MGPRCNFCDAAKRLLVRNNIPFKEINIALEDRKKRRNVKQIKWKKNYTANIFQ